MCGIAGWVDFERDLMQERELARRMTATMAKRGPDAEGLWLSPRAALGHRRLSIIDLEGGRQPMIATENGAPVAVLVYTGEVYNFRELRAELESLGHRFETRSDTEVVLHAYLQWGASFPERLEGMFAFALWDERKQELLLVRDRLGIKPLYYQPTPAGVLFGSEPKAILENPLAPPVVDADGLRDILVFVKTPGRAVFRDMREVKPGHVLHIRKDGITERQYWALEARPHTDDLATTIRTIRELLEDIVSRQLISDVPLCSLLSGGLDSSVVTALAQKALLAEGAGPVRSFSVDFVGQTENFQADEFRASPDAPFVADVARHVASVHSDIVLSSDELAAPAVRDAVLAARDLPLSFGDLDASLYLLFQAIRRHSTVALSGESADEVFGGYLWFHDAEAVAAETFPWMAFRSKRSDPPRSRFLPTLLDRSVLQKLDLDDYIDQRYRDAIAEVPRLPGETGHERRMREICHLHLMRFLPLLLDRKDRMSMASGLEVRVPFCDHRLVQYVFNTPWAMKTFDGYEKSLLRAASVDLLPRSVLERRKSPYPSTQDPAYDRALRGQIGRLLAHRDAPVLPLLDLDHARAFAAGNDAGNGGSARAPMEQALGLNAWLEHYEVRLAV
ncbi:asparagine synthase (glutamine-hydrolyzing) [Polyangium sp. 6x1]|uniref:asparagine synthase (glutamine-hydrolyzing) n=1 Tax=Polyangium sp. 6x1 TaxID=3042689 RepID=UPI002482BB18|nr:asparagine synthase (glutamine-hydrolyzing) [Polyangium sp. 6x1]MDI1449808.1 asparagine synthase (glutamine-hydrolyzing) [Polyangium sp. 6x1]